MDELNRPTWSKSQINALKECGRKAVLSAKNQSTFPDGDRLKKLKNRFLWTGSIVHEVVGETLKTLRQGEPAPDVEAVINKTRERMRDEFKKSKENPGSEGRLFEHEYNARVNPDAWKKQWNGVELSLRWFFGSKWIERLKTVPPEAWKTVDEVLSFDIDGIKAYVKIDCALELDGRFILIDWKTSPLKPGDAASLSVAALYAHETWGAEPDAIDAHAVSLLDGKSERALIDEDVLMESFMKIQEEAGWLTEQKETLGADIEMIPLPSNVDLCRRCNFQRLCHPSGVKEKEFSYANAN
jgi:hypothetical protein